MKWLLFIVACLSVPILGAQKPPEYWKPIERRGDWQLALAEGAGYYKMLADQLKASTVSTPPAAIAIAVKNNFADGATPADYKVTALLRLYVDDEVLGKNDDFVWEVRAVPSRSGGRISGLAWIGVATGKFKVLYPLRNAARTAEAKVTPVADFPAFGKPISEGDWFPALASPEALNDPHYENMAKMLKQTPVSRRTGMTFTLPDRTRTQIGFSPQISRLVPAFLPANGDLVVIAILRLLQPDGELGSQQDDFVWEIHTLIGGGQTATVSLVDVNTGKLKVLYAARGFRL